VVFGYTCANDVTARDIQRASGENTWAKCFDTFCPLGPWVATGLDVSDLAIRCAVNGEIRQDSRTSALIYDVPALVSHISQAMTLLPGDVILTGTPAGVSAIHPGDEVTVTIILLNRVTTLPEVLCGFAAGSLDGGHGAAAVADALCKLLLGQLGALPQGHELGAQGFLSLNDEAHGVGRRRRIIRSCRSAPTR
jgi:hypothetical protein